MTNGSESLRPSLPEDRDPLKSLSMDRDPEARANIWAAIDISRKYLTTDKDGYFDYKSEWRMLEGLSEKIFPGLDNVQIKEILEKNNWPGRVMTAKTNGYIITANTNDDPKDQEEFRWFIRIWDGTVDRYQTKREEYAKSHSEAKERADIIEKYCYQIQGVVPWYDISYEEKEELERHRKSAAEEAKAKGDVKPTDRELELQEWHTMLDTLYSNKPEGMSDKEWNTKRSKARKLRRELNKQQETDNKLRYNVPTWVFNHRVGRLVSRCYCTVENIRKGHICKICKLSKKADDYTLELFKDAAEGRSTVV